MLTIRLTRKGRKNQPFFRVVVIDKKRSAKGGRAVEILGFVDPLGKKKSLEKERILYWIKNGAQPSDTVHNLLISEKIIDGKKINVSKKSKKKTESTAEPIKVESVSATSETSATPATSVTPENTITTQVVESLPTQTGEKPKAEGQKTGGPEEPRDEGKKPEDKPVESSAPK